MGASAFADITVNADTENFKYTCPFTGIRHKAVVVERYPTYALCDVDTWDDDISDWVYRYRECFLVRRW